MSNRTIFSLLGCLMTLSALAEEPPADRPEEPPQAAVRVFDDQSSFLKAADIEHTSDFENLPRPRLDHPLTFEKVTYATWHRSRPGKTSGHLIASSTREMGRHLSNNSFPDVTVTFGKRRMVTAIGFHIIPARKEAGDWEITLTSPLGKTHVESFSHKADVTPHYRGFISPRGIVSVRITRPEGRKSPNHGIDNVSHSAIVAVEVTPEVVAAETSWLGPLETTVRRRPGPMDSPLEPAVAGIWKDAGVGSDPEYLKLIREEDREKAAAPLDMRRVLVYWQGPKRLRDWPHVARFYCGDGCLRLSWKGELATASDASQARERFQAALEAMDYREVKGQEQIAALAKRVGMSMENIERWAHSSEYQMFTRTAGDTEMAVLCDVCDYVGSEKYQCGVDFNWLAARPYPHAQPTLGETLAVMPTCFQVPYLNRSFFVALKREPIDFCSAGRGLSIHFPEDVSKQLISAIEADGFEYRREHEPLRDGSIQKTWYRFTDVTFAHITRHPESTRTRFSCQMPQHTGEPRTTKPPPMHPNLRLPRSKRPELPFEQLPFASDELRRQTRLFYDLADRIAQDDWFVQRFKDVRYSNAPSYLARWGTDEERGTSVPRKFMPYRSIAISVNGPRPEGDEEQVTRSGVTGCWIPSEGWAAQVACQMEVPGRLSGNVTVARVHHGPTFSFHSGSRDHIRLLDDRLSASVTQDNGYRFHYDAQRRADPRAERSPEEVAEAERRFLALFESPTRLRDTAIGNLDTLRQMARAEIPQLKNIRVVDTRREAEPEPGPELPADEMLPTEATKKQLLEEILAALDAREKIIRENCEQIHAAISTALPLGEIRDSLAE